MKVKKLFTLVPALAVLTLVGSGFSAWVFNEAKTETFNFNGSLNVVTASNLSLTTPDEAPEFKVIFDQGGFKNANDVTKGITVTGIDKYTFTLEATDLPLVGDQIDLTNNSLKINYSLEVTDGSEYVESSLMATNQAISFNLSSTSGSGTYYSYESKTNQNSDGTTGNITFSITINLKSTDGSVLYYVEGKKPTNSASWVEMDKSVKSSGIGLNLNISASLS